MVVETRPFQHTVSLHGRMIALNLEPSLWRAFQRLAAERQLSRKSLLEQIYAEAGHYGKHPSLSSLVRDYLAADLLRRLDD